MASSAATGRGLHKGRHAPLPRRAPADREDGVVMPRTSCISHFAFSISHFVEMAFAMGSYDPSHDPSLWP